MRKNKEKDMTPYDMSQKPSKQNPFLFLLTIICCRLMLTTRKLKIKRIGIKGLKPPYLVLSEHQGYTDYYITPLALFPHRANYVSDVEGFAAYGKNLYRKLGCIPTRRFTSDVTLPRNISHAVHANKSIVVIFPEARHSNIGTNSSFPPAVGKLVKSLGIPVVLLKNHGSYLTTPIWDEAHRRKVPLSTNLELVLTPEMISEKNVNDLNILLNQKFFYDEYQWQRENRVINSYPKRAEGLHKVLYQCPNCKAEYQTTSSESFLNCGNCKKQWQMDEYGTIMAKSGITEFPYIPDWYEFQRSNVIEEINKGEYSLEEEVKIEALPNEKGFVNMGLGLLTHNKQGFDLIFLETKKHLHFSAKSLFSLHTEYDYKKKGDCIALSTKDCCYYLYFKTPNINVTKIHFAVEYFHSLT